ncbi:MAG TPA: O-methyltransferase [Candidatus Acidoferrales bacterium]|jgi:predicted O-methyltransferase YrrM|nr:O-methyltransferase [Candidatus Acidoferrales bacterium]
MTNLITGAAVEKYFYSLLPARDAVLSEMERLAHKRDIPIVGPAVGRLLALLVKISGAKRIFEMGSAIGYSTIWLARAAGRGAEVFYSDGDPANALRAKAYFRRAGVSGKIRVLVGDSLDLLSGTSGEFDFIFIDVDKHQYPAAFRRAVPRLSRGGLLVADNTLWSGRVTRKTGDRATRGIQEFNRLTYSSKKLFPVLLPLRDGVTVCVKL